MMSTVVTVVSVTESISDRVTEPMPEAVTDAVCKPMTEPVMAPVANPVSEAVTAVMRAPVMPDRVMSTVMLCNTNPWQQERHTQVRNTGTKDKRPSHHDASATPAISRRLESVPVGCAIYAIEAACRTDTAKRKTRFQHPTFISARLVREILVEGCSSRPVSQHRPHG